MVFVKAPISESHPPTPGSCIEVDGIELGGPGDPITCAGHSHYHELREGLPRLKTIYHSLHLDSFLLELAGTVTVGSRRVWAAVEAAGWVDSKLVESTGHGNAHGHHKGVW